MNRPDSAKLPTRFTRNITDLHGESGVRWLARLSDLVEEIAGEWLLEVESPYPNLSYNYVAPCVFRADPTKAVLKIGFAEENSILFSEAKVLEFLGGSGAVKLLKFDKKYCALLLERVSPGENLTELCRKNDEQATAAAIELMKSFWREPPNDNDFPSLENWIQGLNQAEKTIFPQQFIIEARRNFDELSSDSKQSFLLHGDLHHENILSATRAPHLAIDPKGIVGDIGYDIAVFLNNPRGWILNHPNRKEILENRIAKFVDAFEIEPRNLRRWAYAEAVLSAWWTFEDNGADWEKWLACAEIWENE